MASDGRKQKQQTVLVEQEYQNQFNGEIQHTFEAERKRACIGRVTIQKGVIFDKGNFLPAIMQLIFYKMFFQF